MIDLYLKGTNELLGSITETELQYLEDSMEETSAAVGSGEGVEIEWKKR